MIIELFNHAAIAQQVGHGHLDEQLLLNFEDFQEFIDVGAWVYFFQDVGEDSIFIDDEGAAFGDVEEGFSEDGFLAQDTVGCADDSFWVAYQWEGESFFDDEFMMTFDGVMADAEEFDLGLDCAPLITNGACLGGSAGGGIFWIEVENYFVPDEV